MPHSHVLVSLKKKLDGNLATDYDRKVSHQPCGHFQTSKYSHCVYSSDKFYLLSVSFIVKILRQIFRSGIITDTYKSMYSEHHW